VKIDKGQQKIKIVHTNRPLKQFLPIIFLPQLAPPKQGTTKNKNCPLQPTIKFAGVPANQFPPCLSTSLVFDWK